MTVKTIIITGSASGIGLKLTNRLFKEGHRILATDVNENGLHAAARVHGWDKSRGMMLAAHDVRSAESWDACVASVVKRWGKLDVLLNIAGILIPSYSHEIDEAHIQKHLDINVKGVMLGTMAAAKHMVMRREGHIVNMASLAGVTPVPGLAVYSGSKHAVRGFTLSAALDLKEHGVDVSCVCPDAVDTPMLDLQKDYEEASLTFSGPQPLTADEVVAAIVEDVLPNKTLETLLAPNYSGRAQMARMASLFPDLGMKLGTLIRKQARKSFREKFGARK
ncbi:MAG: SDR family oxidoreductase [Deltaproteobacteria bacterium]|jgi:3-oxoacyl-[acyl-carrier protein] reductase|nr:SDR family oxidoreductase [Deltaproteobacteria bacterium]